MLMKRIFTVMTLMVMMLSSESLFAQRKEKHVHHDHQVVASKVVNPTFNGGSIHDFALWVNSQIETPRSFATSGVAKIVLVEFMVTEDGSVADIHAVFGSNKELNETAVKAVSRSPKWTPAEVDGVKTKVRMTVPVLFEGD